MFPNQIGLSDAAHSGWFHKLLLGFLSLVVILHIFMVFRFQVSWDEFFLLEWVYKWNSGELNLALQTIYLRAFSWLPRIGENEVTQIIAARSVMFVCLGITCGFIYSLCRKFTGTVNSLLGLIFFLTMTFVFMNATSFRADMVVTPVLMGVLWLLVTPDLSWKRIFIAAALLGLAGMITIKAVFYVPIVLGILFAHWGYSDWSRPVFLKSTALGISALLFFGVLYLLHSTSLGAFASSADYLKHSTKGSLFEAGFFPTRNAFYFAVQTNPLFFVFLLLGLGWSLLKVKKTNYRWSYVAAAFFTFPLLTLVFYRHSHPYFYSFMLAPATLLIAIGLSVPLLKKYTVVLFSIVAILFIHTTSNASKVLTQNLDTQKEVLTIVHKLFPTATAYIDRCAMVSTYPKSGLFMSHWMMNDYYKAKRPIMENILLAEQPKFILANIDSLNLNKIEHDTDRRFLPKDEEMLKQNYISHWGPIYVAGKSLQTQADMPQNLQIFIEGSYGIESIYPVNINGKTHNPGDSISLDQGTHILTSTKSQNITLRWNSLAIPDTEPPKRKLFF